MYFDNMKTIDEVKSRYRVLAKLLHPDIGGDKIIMQEINNEYEKSKNKLKCTGKDKDFSFREKIKHVLKWSENNPSFDPSFVISLWNWLSSGRELSDAQLGALDKIIKKFKINLSE